ncbi:hypothetical protein B0G73_12223 [Paraburkholderia sp. BL25I1N1]|nr:hypothetical protein B0G73_12223 [Paraburkholderia sp. BL25I1N1]
MRPGAPVAFQFRRTDLADAEPAVFHRAVLGSNPFANAPTCPRMRAPLLDFRAGDGILP